LNRMVDTPDMGISPSYPYKSRTRLFIDRQTVGMQGLTKYRHGPRVMLPSCHARS